MDFCIFTKHSVLMLTLLYVSPLVIEVRLFQNTKSNAEKLIYNKKTVLPKTIKRKIRSFNQEDTYLKMFPKFLITADYFML